MTRAGLALAVALLLPLASSFSPSAVLHRNPLVDRLRTTRASGPLLAPAAPLARREAREWPVLQSSADSTPERLAEEERDRTAFLRTDFAEEEWDGISPRTVDWNKMGKLRIIYPDDLSLPHTPPHMASKPLLLFIPGIDGNGVFGNQQFESLSEIYEVRVMQIPADDRLDFDGLVAATTEFLKKWIEVSPSKDLPQLFGESAGALTSLGVAIRSPQLVHGVTLANPATAFSQTAWPVLGNALAQFPGKLPGGQERIPDILKRLNAVEDAEALGLNTNRSLADLAYLSTAGPVIAAAALDGHQMAGLLGVLSEGVSEILRAVPQGPVEARATAKRFMEERVLPNMDMVFDFMSPDAISHRLDNVLQAGARYVNPRLTDIKVPVLVLVGDKDATLPSERDSKRLAKQIPQCTRKVVEGGHLILDDRYNVTKAMLASPVAPLSTRRDPVTGFQMPSKEAVDNATQSLSFLKRIGSPVFLTTNPETMQVDVGLDNLREVLKEGPVLFVGNHQLLALDLGPMVEGVYRETGTLMRGLAHPMLFNANGMGLPGMQGGVGEGNVYETFGAVPVTASNAYKLLAQGDAVLLFPGGMGEAMHGKNELYTLKWPEKTDFVRLAARFGATIVPFGGVGASECAQVLADPSEVEEFSRTPVGRMLGGLIPMQSDRSFGQQGLNSERLSMRSMPPIIAPNAPWEFKRFYFMFGAPIHTKGINLKDADECARLYKDARVGVEQCIDYLLEHRESDPYKDLGRRVIYETRFARQAPTFRPPALHQRERGGV